jgi:hypothetical protein
VWEARAGATSAMFDCYVSIIAALGNFKSDEKKKKKRYKER